jgi:hypothetical protein
MKLVKNDFIFSYLLFLFKLLVKVRKMVNNPLPQTPRPNGPSRHGRTSLRTTRSPPATASATATATAPAPATDLPQVGIEIVNLDQHDQHQPTTSDPNQSWYGRIKKHFWWLKLCACVLLLAKLLGYIVFGGISLGLGLVAAAIILMGAAILLCGWTGV